MGASERHGVRFSPSILSYNPLPQRSDRSTPRPNRDCWHSLLLLSSGPHLLTAKFPAEIDASEVRRNQRSEGDFTIRIWLTVKNTTVRPRIQALPFAVR